MYSPTRVSQIQRAPASCRRWCTRAAPSVALNCKPRLRVSRYVAAGPHLPCFRLPKMMSPPKHRPACFSRALVDAPLQLPRAYLLQRYRVLDRFIREDEPRSAFENPHRAPGGAPSSPSTYLSKACAARLPRFLAQVDHPSRLITQPCPPAAWPPCKVPPRILQP